MMNEVGLVTDPVQSLVRLREELANPPFHDVLGPVAERVEADGTVVVRLPYQPEFCGRRGGAFFHGGVIASLVDIAAHAAVATRTGRMAPTIDLRIDYLKAAPATELFATARVLRLGRSVSRADVEIRCSVGELVAVGRGTFSTLIN